MQKRDKQLRNLLLALSPCGLVSIFVSVLGRIQTGGQESGLILFFSDPIAVIYVVVVFGILLSILSGRSRTIFLISCLALVLALGGGWIIWKQFIQPPPPVLSLKDLWNSIEISAHNLQSDAYLTRADFDIRRDDGALYAEYYSPSVPDNGIEVSLESSRQISSRWWDSPPDGLLQPIYLTDWSVDSQDALGLFAKIPLARSCLTASSPSVIYLSLYPVDAGYPVWDLDLWNCPEFGSEQHYYLNAQTSEVIQLPK
jgi:hypothetical protein